MIGITVSPISFFWAPEIFRELQSQGLSNNFSMKQPLGGEKLIRIMERRAMSVGGIVLKMSVQ